MADLPKIEAAVRSILEAIGEDPDRDGLKDTPKRVAKSYADLCRGLGQTADDLLEVSFDIGYDEMVLVKDIEMFSMCEHHLLPFHGKAHVGYIPGPEGRVTGLSKLARLADMYAKRPQVQERLTAQIADAIVDKLGASAVIVVLECEHLCMAMRGIRKPGAVTTTSAVRGGFQKNAASRAEVLSLIRS